MKRRTKVTFKMRHGFRFCLIKGMLASYRTETNAFYSYGYEYPASDFYTHEYVYPNTSLFRKLLEKEVDKFIKSGKIYVRKLIIMELNDD